MKLAPMAEHPEIIIDTERHPLLERVNRGDVVNARDVTGGHDQHRRRRHEGDALLPDEAQAHLADLRDMTEEANRTMAAKGLPYRFLVMSEAGELYITVLRRSADGREIPVQRLNVTHTEFLALVRKIEQGEGLFYEVVG